MQSKVSLHLYQHSDLVLAQLFCRDAAVVACLLSVTWLEGKKLRAAGKANVPKEDSLP